MVTTDTTPATDPMSTYRDLDARADELGRAAIAASNAIRAAADDMSAPDGTVATARAAARVAWDAADDARAAAKIEYARVRDTPVIGGPATICYPSDAYPAVVTRVTRTTVTVRMVEHGDATSDASEGGLPVVTATGILDRPQGGERKFTYRARKADPTRRAGDPDGYWIGVGGSIRDGVRVVFGSATYRRDYRD